MIGEMLKPYEVLRRGETGCIHHFIIDEHLVGECIKCSEKRRWPFIYEDHWDKRAAMKYAMRQVKA